MPTPSHPPSREPGGAPLCPAPGGGDRHCLDAVVPQLCSPHAPIGPRPVLAPILAPLRPGPYPILIPPPRGIPRATIDRPGPAPPRRDQSVPRSAPGPAAGNTLRKRLDQSAPRSAPSLPPIGVRRGGAAALSARGARSAGDLGRAGRGGGPAAVTALPSPPPLPSPTAPAPPAVHPQVLLLQPCGAPTVLRLPP